MTKTLIKDWDKFLLRLPPGVRDSIKERSKRDEVSMNDSIVQCLEEKNREEEKAGLFYVSLADIMALESLQSSAMIGPFKDEKHFNAWCHRYLPRSNKDRA